MDISHSITYHITRTGNILRRLAARRIRNAGLDITPEEAVLMNQLWDRDGQSQAELGRWSVKEASTLTRLIDSLVKKGYLERQRSQTDRRALFIHLTREGQKLRDDFEATGIRQMDRELAQTLGKDAERLLRELETIGQTALLQLQDE